ncbi:hypothetical protein Vretimale_730 [Volvox reticuliferus]|uniref:Uncharacterized protein n=1 Tax=Volvox reticuliferus TaxID=1737510 RepID=A0A8J4FYU8_9CHLO|nr:hypothetical protein Vretifemale_10564 [Volvox reticuliferus]GIL94767.1 hypothetical protein Vretimale_730 [Volvox reticuliferus]
MRVLARFMGKPSKTHLGLALGVLRYLAGTKELGLRELKMEGYSDSDWAGDPVTRRSTIGYGFLLGGAAISWNSQLQLRWRQNIRLQQQQFARLYGSGSFRSALRRDWDLDGLSGGA